MLTEPTLSLLFVHNKLILFCNTLYLEILLQPALGLPQQGGMFCVISSEAKETEIRTLVLLILKPDFLL